MRWGDYHIHTTFCDGENTPEELVEAALASGMPAVGFSGHSHTAFDESWCMSREGTAQYRREIAVLREKYDGRIRILCGVEQDYYSDMPVEGYDYVIGSVHYLRKDGAFFPVDESRADLEADAKTFFGGDYYAFAEAYFETVSHVAEKTRCDIIGHFDLIAKFNGGNAFFDEEHPRYIAAWQKAADRLLEAGKLFEINTGAMARGYRTEPYPAAPILRYLAERGAGFILSSDSHSIQTLCSGFSDWQKTAEESGLRLALLPCGL